ncbi:MAG TPA: histidine kinase [Pseudonocardiaceae bacterium]|nr:histidine kinase [Pseudonocardiaceae bacterium]
MITLLEELYTPRSLVDYVMSVVYITIMLGLQLFYVSRASPRPRPPLSYLALLAQAALAYLPLLRFQEFWVGPSGFLAGSVLLLLPPVLAWSASALIVAIAAVAQAAFTGAPIDIAYTTVSTTITALVVYGLTRLATLLTELHKARITTARMAVAEERKRFARDLHDLLGYSLSAITLKSELILRLLPKRPAEAEHLVLEVLDISRRAVADVRAVASGYQEVSLDAEMQSVSSVLTAADVVVQMNLDYGQLPTRVSETLAILLREGVTNVLRHSKAEHCEITIRQEAGHVTMDIVNDGAVGGSADRPTVGGSGIDNLSARIASLGGAFNAGLDDEGWFRLHATAPVVFEQTF